MKIHKSITIARVVEAVEGTLTNLESPGFCLACGADADGCEPDAQGYECESCGKNKVYGAEECLFLVGG